MNTVISFGRGKRPLVIAPGLSTRNMDESAAMLPGIFKKFLDDWTVYVIDRPEEVPEGTTNADLAEAYYQEMVRLGIGPADIIGASQGGMIAQHIAVRHPEAVHAVVLGATLGKMNETAEATIGAWIRFAENDDWDGFSNDLFTKLYTAPYIERYRKAFDLLAKNLKPDDTPRFIRLAKACLTGGPADELDKITCPALVMGGEDDPVVSGQASRDLAEKIGCELLMFKGLRHAIYDEDKEFYNIAHDFLDKLYEKNL